MSHLIEADGTTVEVNSGKYRLKPATTGHIFGTAGAAPSASVNAAGGSPSTITAPQGSLVAGYAAAGTDYITSTYAGDLLVGRANGGSILSYNYNNLMFGYASGGNLYSQGYAGQGPEYGGSNLIFGDAPTGNVGVYSSYGPNLVMGNASGGDVTVYYPGRNNIVNATTYGAYYCKVTGYHNIVNANCYSGSVALGASGCIVSGYYGVSYPAYNDSFHLGSYIKMSSYYYAGQNDPYMQVTGPDAWTYPAKCYADEFHSNKSYPYGYYGGKTGWVDDGANFRIYFVGGVASQIYDTVAAGYYEYPGPA